MRIELTIKHQFGKDRYFPVNAEALALLELIGRKCLKDVEVQRLQMAGFPIFVTTKQEVSV